MQKSLLNRLCQFEQIMDCVVALFVRSIISNGIEKYIELLADL